MNRRTLILVGLIGGAVVVTLFLTQRQITGAIAEQAALARAEEDRLGVDFNIGFSKFGR